MKNGGRNIHHFCFMSRYYFAFSFRMRRTLWLMRSSVMTPFSTASMTASKAWTKFCGPSTMSTN